jgi:hypothetical protein
MCWWPASLVLPLVVVLAGRLAGVQAWRDEARDIAAVLHTLR